LRRHAEAQIEGRTANIILQPLGSLDAALSQEFAKGETSGIKLFIRYPETLVEMFEAELKMEEQRGTE
jgi:hypothetical protein